MQKLDDRKIGTEIRRIRKARGWSQEELAKRCGVSLNFIGQIERGTRSMSLDTFASVCRELEADADALLSGVPQSCALEIQSVCGQTGQMDRDNYAMYIQIMKSVADIMKSGNEFS